MNKDEKLKQFFEQIRGTENPTAQNIRNAAAATGDVSEIIPVILSYAAGVGIDAAAELADLTKAQEAVRKTAEGKENGRMPHFERVTTAEIKPVAWIVKKIIERGTVVLVFGDSGTGKSFFAISLAASIATGTGFFDYPVKRPGAVLYVAGEGISGLSRRFYAWEIAHGRRLNDAPVFRYTGAANLIDRPDELSLAIEGHIEEHGEPRVIIFDTWARTIGGDDSNSQDAAVAMAALDRIRARYPELTVLIVHHSGHTAKDRARGWSGLSAAMDSVYRLEKSDTQIVVTNTKQKEDAPVQPMAFTLLNVKLDGVISEDGEQEYSACCEPCEYTPPERQPKGENQQAVITILREQGSMDRSALYGAFTVKTGKRKSQFDQTLNPLIDRKIVKFDGGILSV
ncbi:MAG: helicase RepA family protein [Treponema sp.]|nr:helicase RepA family protein [Treponema sp.]